MIIAVDCGVGSQERCANSRRTVGWGVGLMGSRRPSNRVSIKMWRLGCKMC